MATAGLRPEEALQLGKKDVVRRNAVLALHVHDSKTESSERYIPVPEVLLRLGFGDWVNEQRGLPGLLLFPEVADIETQSRMSEIFGGRFTSIRKGLKIADDAEDFYALRRTCNSRLTAAGVPHPDCQGLPTTATSSRPATKAGASRTAPEPTLTAPNAPDTPAPPTSSGASGAFPQPSRRVPFQRR